MAVDLFDLVDPLKREVNPPGENLFPNATDEDYLGNLQDAFWEARLDGLLSGFEEADGSVTPISGTTDLGRELQQLVVIWAGMRIVRNQLRQLKTVFRAQAGPVGFETQQSAQTLKGLLDELKEKRLYLLNLLATSGVVSSYYIDAVAARDLSMSYGDTHWIGY